MTYTMSRMRELVKCVWCIRPYIETNLSCPPVPPPPEKHAPNALSGCGQCAITVSLDSADITFNVDLVSVAHINWLGAELQKTVTAVPDGVDLSIMVYVTNTNGASANGSATQTLNGLEQDGEKDIDPEKDGEYDEKSPVEVVDTPAFDSSLDMKDVTVIHGRPDIRKILEDSVALSSGPVSVDGRLCSIIVDIAEPDDSIIQYLGLSPSRPQSVLPSHHRSPRLSPSSRAHQRCNSTSKASPCRRLLSRPPQSTITSIPGWGVHAK